MYKCFTHLDVLPLSQTEWKQNLSNNNYPYKSNRNFQNPLLQLKEIRLGSTTTTISESGKSLLLLGEIFDSNPWLLKNMYQKYVEHVNAIYAAWSWLGQN